MMSIMTITIIVINHNHHRLDNGREGRQGFSFYRCPRLHKSRLTPSTESKPLAGLRVRRTTESPTTDSLRSMLDLVRSGCWAWELRLGLGTRLAGGPNPATAPVSGSTVRAVDWVDPADPAGEKKKVCVEKKEKKL